MRIEVLCTGDELLTGLTADTNSPYFMAKVLELGEKVSLAQCVPDDRQAITGAIRQASERAEVVLVSGGLGPTADDFTAECAAAAAGVPLVEDAQVLAKLKARAQKRGFTFTANNARQAQVPQGAQVVPNRVGSAPMFILQLGRCTFFFVPGVPHEYKTLVEEEVLPRIQALLLAQPHRLHHAFLILNTVGVPESHLDAQIAPLAEHHPQIVFGYRTRGPENQLKLLSRAETPEAAHTALLRAERACREILGDVVFAAGDVSLVQSVTAQLVERHETLSLAESCTGGSLANALTAIPGASQWLWGGAIAYTEAAKQALAQVPRALLDEHTAVSAEAAQALAEGIRAISKTTWGLSTVGFAGPGGGTPENPLGTVYVSCAGPSGTRTVKHLLLGDRERIRRFAGTYALDLLRKAMSSHAPTAGALR